MLTAAEYCRTDLALSNQPRSVTGDRNVNSARLL